MPRPAADDAWRPLIDMRTVVAAVVDTRRWVAALALLGLVAGVLLATTIPKYFYSTVELLVDPRDLKISERELMPTGLPYDASLAIVENQTKIITSRRVLEATVDAMKLAADPEFNGKGLAVPGPLARIVELVAGADPADEARMRETAVQELQRAVSVTREPKSFVVFLTVRSEVADKAALIANTMSGIYLEAQQEIQRGAAERASGEIGGRLEALRTDLEAAERAVETYKSENELFDANGKLISDDEILLISTQLTQARQRVAELRSRADSARQLTIDQVLSDALPEGAASNLISELRRGYAQKAQQRDALSQKLGAAHPQLQTAEAEVASAARAIETELRRLSQTTQIELQRAVQTEQELASNLARLKSRQSDISERLVLLRELEREAATRRSIYENFLLRARETTEQAGISTANTSIVSNAVPALRSYGTSRKLVAVGGLLGGLLLGIGLGVLRGIWRCLRATDGPEDDLADAPAQAVAAPADTPRAPVRRTPTDPAAKAPAEPRTEAEMFHPAYPYAQPSPAQPAPMAMPGYAPQMMAQPIYPQPMPQMMAQPMPQMMAQPMPQTLAQPAYWPAPGMMPQGFQPHMHPQPAYPQMMAQPMANMMAQPMPQMMAQPMPQMMAQPMPQMMAQPAPVHVHVSAPAGMAPAAQPAVSPAPAGREPQDALAAASAYEDIRDRLRALRDGIASLAEKRDRLHSLG